MGFGCNAAGVVGCRIIDSERERLIAMLTNAFIPCNGKFPTLIAMISMFFVTGSVIGGSVATAFVLSGMIVLAVAATLGCSALLSHTLLKGKASSYTLELPPYRTPQVGSVIVRSVLDRTLFVLGRAVVVAAPAGLILWILGNVSPGEVSLLTRIAGALDPVGRFLGLDGAIVLAFLLALPANEIVIPVMLMTYTASGSLVDYTSLAQLKELLVTNGWTSVTVICMATMMLFHFPCSTTLMTIRRESGSWRWVAVAALLPTLLGAGLCVLIVNIAKLFG